LISFVSFAHLYLDPILNSEVSRRSVKGALDEILYSYDDGGNSTVVDLIAYVLTDLLGGSNLLSRPVQVAYFEHMNEESLVRYENYDDSLDVKSIMWEIHFGEF